MTIDRNSHAELVEAGPLEKLRVTKSVEGYSSVKCLQVKMHHPGRLEAVEAGGRGDGVGADLLSV
jgi:hypothetical protein